MKRKKWFQALPLMCSILFLAGYAQNTGSPVMIQNVLVQPSPVCPKVILQTDGELTITNAAYSLTLPRTLVLDLGKASIPSDLAVSTEGEPLFEEIKFVPNGEGLLRLFLSLKEQAFFRLSTEEGQAVLELNKILDPQTADVFDPSFRQQLSQRKIVTSNLGAVNVVRDHGNVRVQAAVENRTPCHVFALSNPLRLVVDLFDTVFNRPTSSFSVGEAGVSKFKVGQFQNQNPYTITRMVFDIDEPGGYRLDFGEHLLSLSFFGSEENFQPASVSTPAPEPAPKARTKTEPEPAAEPPAQEPAEEKPKAEPRTETQPAVKPAETPYRAQVLGGEETPFSGEVLSVKVKDQDLRDIILYLGEFAGLNVIFDPDVRGRVTCNFEYVPWDQILDAILRTNKMGKVLEGNVLRIAPIAVLTRETEDENKMRESRELSGPLITKTFTLSYSKARDAERLLQQKKSGRGKIDVDERTNTLIVTEVRNRMELLEKLINLMDTPTPQVSIEARIVEATSNFIRNLGFQWGFMGQADAYYGNQTNLEFPNKIGLNGALIPQGQVTRGLGGPLGGYAINLPAPTFTSALGLSLANVLDTFRLDATLSAMETSGQGRIISCPKVTAQNNREAEIIQGRQIPIQTMTNFTVTTRYVNAALELRATPQITAEGTIIMNIDIQNNAADFSNQVNGIPSITRQSASTTVMIPDGGTTVIGGIYRTEDTTTLERVPLLHKIPLLGNLFKSSARTRQNRELLIFITPRIIRQGGQP
ncbi:MAG: type IV pilus secretin PilQ [Candidatus Aminicenantes bacterium]|nr:type IV pilus secretin PilQ [Candidatus Aminicenantes bacterium]